MNLRTRNEDGWRKVIGLLACVALFTASSVFAGDDAGNGVDNHRFIDGAAWFAGDSGPVRACVEVAPHFSRPKHTLEAFVKMAYTQWANYMRDRLEDSDPRLRPNAEIEIVSCELAEVTFYFGIENDLVRKEKLLYRSPVGMAKRQSYNAEKGRGKGFVWIAADGSVKPEANYPDWSLPHNLYGVLLHEIGHILGTGHFEGTIMTSFLALHLESPQDNPDRVWLTRIDHSRQLSPMIKGVYSQESIFGEGGDRDDREEVFSLLLNRKPEGLAKAIFETNLDYFTANSAVLTLEDNLGRTRFPITLVPDYSQNLPPRGTYFVGTDHAFKVYRLVEGEEIATTYLQYGYIVYGSLKNLKGQTVNLALDYGSMVVSESKGMFNLKLIHEGKALVVVDRTKTWDFPNDGEEGEEIRSFSPLKRLRH